MISKSLIPQILKLCLKTKEVVFQHGFIVALLYRIPGVMLIWGEGLKEWGLILLNCSRNTPILEVDFLKIGNICVFPCTVWLKNIQ